MIITPTTLTSRRRIAGAVALLSLALPLLAACGSSDSSASGAPSGAPTSGQQAGRGGAGGQQVPGAAGLIAEIDGTTLQVQSTSEQTAVTYTKKTTFTTEAAVTATALKKGVCVRVTSPQSASSGSSTAPTATGVFVSAQVDGSCTGGFGGGGGGFGGGNGTRPSGAPSGEPGGGRPSGMPSGAANQGFTRPVSGEVTSVGDGSFVVAVTDFAGRRGASASPSASPSTSSVTVTTTSTTTYSTQQATSAKALKVGLCLTARGASSSTGAVAATTIGLSKAVNGQCKTVTGRR